MMLLFIIAFCSYMDEPNQPKLKIDSKQKFHFDRIVCNNHWKITQINRFILSAFNCSVAFHKWYGVWILICPQPTLTKQIKCNHQIGIIRPVVHHFILNDLNGYHIPKTIQRKKKKTSFILIIRRLPDRLIKMLHAKQFKRIWTRFYYVFFKMQIEQLSSISFSFSFSFWLFKLSVTMIRSIVHIAYSFFFHGFLFILILLASAINRFKWMHITLKLCLASLFIRMANLSNTIAIKHANILYLKCRPTIQSKFKWKLIFCSEHFTFFSLFWIYRIGNDRSHVISMRITMMNDEQG